MEMAQGEEKPLPSVGGVVAMLVVYVYNCIIYTYIYIYISIQVYTVYIHKYHMCVCL